MVNSLPSHFIYIMSIGSVCLGTVQQYVLTTTYIDLSDSSLVLVATLCTILHELWHVIKGEVQLVYHD